ncbi:MAG TPA: AMP-binding protein, partial [Roseiflexaceae bacterium]|nr:AMP-binding protein [Roseiflexaceae bacterium]
IQLTSGSTSMPKGVVLSHGNVRAHLAALEQAISYQRTTDRLVSWLPLYHDMGLVQLLSAIYYQSSIVLMTPFSFLRNPLSWLQCISMYGGTIAAAPTFAYSLCVKKFNPDKLADVRLSQWRLAFVGAEPVPWSIVDAFRHSYQPYGLSDSTLFPCYGMAETVLATTLPQRGSFPNRRTGFLSCDRIDATLLRQQGHAVPAPAAQDTDVTPLEVLGMGQPINGLEVCIQNGDGQILGERVVGEICVCGSSLMSSYFHDPEATAQAVRNGWYHTGDCGYMADGELYVLGRIKELIIVRGRNYQPHDIEAVVEQHGAVRKSYCVAFSVYNDAIGTDDVVCVAETNTDSDLFPGIIQEIQASLQAACGFTAHAIVLVRHGTLPRTTSGKPQRLLAREWYREGKLTPSTDPVDADRQ